MKVPALVLAAALALASAPRASADVPPPPGYTRVAYSYQLAAPVEGRAIVAFPTYTSGGGVPGVRLRRGSCPRCPAAVAPSVPLRCAPRLSGDWVADGAALCRVKR